MAQTGHCKFTITIEWSGGDEDKFYLITLASSSSDNCQRVHWSQRGISWGWRKYTALYLYLPHQWWKIISHNLLEYIFSLFFFSFLFVCDSLIRCLLPSLIVFSMSLNMSFIFFISFQHSGWLSSFIQQTLIEHLPCGKHCSRHLSTLLNKRHLSAQERQTEETDNK